MRIKDIKIRLQEADPMYAVVNSGGKQYKVQQGQILRVEKIPGDVGNPVTFERVLMFSDGENVSIGQPELEDVLARPLMESCPVHVGQPRFLVDASLGVGPYDVAAT